MVSGAVREEGMEDIYLFIGAAVLLAVQILCFFCKKVWVRLIPLFVILVLLIVCAVMYLISKFTNWAYLIRFLLLTVELVVLGMLWLGFSIVCKIKQL